MKELIHGFLLFVCSVVGHNFTRDGICSRCGAVTKRRRIKWNQKLLASYV